MARAMDAVPERLRIVIAEDAAIMRDGLTQTLTRRGHEVVAAVADAEALLRAIDEHQPDVAIIDVRMPPTHTDEGLRAARSIHTRHPGVGVLVFSQYVETQLAAELFASAPAGVGYLLKDRVADVSDLGGDGGGTRDAAQPLPECASRPAGRRGRPGGDGCAANRPCDLDAQVYGNARAGRLGQRDAPAVH
jgi:CheY-like chemotaxis protein